MALKHSHKTHYLFRPTLVDKVNKTPSIINCEEKSFKTVELLSSNYSKLI